jgi:hypothetical protein
MSIISLLRSMRRVRVQLGGVRQRIQDQIDNVPIR